MDPVGPFLLGLVRCFVQDWANEAGRESLRAAMVEQLRNDVEAWILTIPGHLRPGVEALFDSPGSAVRGLAREVASVGRLPTTNEWLGVLEAAHSSVREALDPHHRAAFIALDPSEARPFLEDLAGRLYSACVQDPRVFRASTTLSLTTILEEVRAIRHSTTVPDPAAVWTIQEPVADFTGREADLTALRAAVGSGGAVLTALRGMGGIGKTQVARKLAQELRAAQQFDLGVEINLDGAGGSPVSPGAALVGLIRSIAPDLGKLPEDLEGLRSAWRLVVGERSLLLLLDNAADAAQVKPLLPSQGSGNVVLVTSRAKFPVPGLTWVPLGVMSPQEAEDLLVRAAPRLAKSPEVVETPA